MLVHYAAEVTFDGRFITHKGTVVEDFESRKWAGLSREQVLRAADRIIVKIVDKFESELG